MTFQQLLPSGNTLKLSYSCMLNLKPKINGPNKKILENTPPLQIKKFKYLKKENCSIKAAYLTQNILYHVKNEL